MTRREKIEEYREFHENLSWADIALIDPYWDVETDDPWPIEALEDAWEDS